MNLPPWINEEFTAECLPAGQMDALWGSGWRRFGQTLFRYSLTLDASGGIDTIIPLRVPLKTFAPTKSQRRILRRNSDVVWDIRPASHSPEILELFERHRQRFRDNVPESLAVFLGQDPSAAPCRCLEFRASLGTRLLAASFLDVDENSVSSVYGIFDPAEAPRSPGILTMLREIEWARAQGMRHYHPGYATARPGIYEYKLQFRPLEGYDWATQAWLPVIERDPSTTPSA